MPWERLRVVTLGATALVGRVRVTFLDANHCPGAAMLLFEPPGRPPILHTGDCRRAQHRPLPTSAGLGTRRSRFVL